MQCPRCGPEMNHHADKLVERVDTPDQGDDRLLVGAIQEIHACPGCGNVEMRLAETGDHRRNPPK